MAGGRDDTHDLTGWTPRGRAQAGARRTAAKRQTLAPILPDRENTLALGEEMITVRRGGGSDKVSANELMIDMLITRAMKGDLASVVDLYARLDREEDAASGTPVPTLSPYMRRKYRGVMLEIFDCFRRMSTELVEAGLAEFDGTKLVVAPQAREVSAHRQAA